jgi:hypothetical protein
METTAAPHKKACVCAECCARRGGKHPSQIPVKKAAGPNHKAEAIALSVVLGVIAVGIYFSGVLSGKSGATNSIGTQQTAFCKKTPLGYDEALFRTAWSPDVTTHSGDATIDAYADSGMQVTYVGGQLVSKTCSR